MTEDRPVDDPTRESNRHISQSMIEKAKKKRVVYIRNFVALPHGTTKDEEVVEEGGLFSPEVPDGVDFWNKKREPKSRHSYL